MKVMAGVGIIHQADKVIESNPQDKNRSNMSPWKSLGPGREVGQSFSEYLQTNAYAGEGRGDTACEKGDDQIRDPWLAGGKAGEVGSQSGRTRKKTHGNSQKGCRRKTCLRSRRRGESLRSILRGPQAHQVRMFTAVVVRVMVVMTAGGFLPKHGFPKHPDPDTEDQHRASPLKQRRNKLIVMVIARHKMMCKMDGEGDRNQRAGMRYGSAYTHDHRMPETSLSSGKVNEHGGLSMAWFQRVDGSEQECEAEG